MAATSKNTINTRSVVRSQPGSLDPLVADLNCDEGIKCRNARVALVTIGKTAVGPLVAALKNGKDMVPLEAAKALGELGGKEATAALILALEDDRAEVRWVSAEALIKIGSPSLKPLLKLLMEKSDSLFVRESAHHVLRDFEDNEGDTILEPVLKALENSVPELEVPLAAKKALDQLE